MSGREAPPPIFGQSSLPAMPSCPNLLPLGSKSLNPAWTPIRDTGSSSVVPKSASSPCKKTPRNEDPSSGPAISKEGRGQAMDVDDVSEVQVEKEKQASLSSSAFKLSTESAPEKGLMAQPQDGLRSSGFSKWAQASSKSAWKEKPQTSFEGTTTSVTRSPFHAPKLSWGFARWSRDASPYVSSGDLPLQDPATQVDTTLLSRSRWWQETAEERASHSEGLCMRRDPSMPSNTSAAPCLPPLSSLPAPVEDDEIMHDNDCKQEEELEEGEILETPRTLMNETGQSASIDYQKATSVSHSLINVSIDTLSDDLVLFYFGVLATQAILLPRVQFQKCRTRWSVKLTMYGHTIQKPSQYNTQANARVAVCREALSVLKAEYPEWRTPNDPLEWGVTQGWDWIELLRDYCVQNGLPVPKYTRLGRAGEHRYSVEIEGRSFIGSSACHTEWDSRNGGAHMAMYSMLVFGNGVTSNYPPLVTLRRSNESMLALVPRFPNGLNKSPDSAGHVGTLKRESDDNVASVGDGPAKKAKKAKKTKKGNAVGCQAVKGKSVNANLVPVNNRRLAEIQVPAQKVEKRWPLTHLELEAQLVGLQSHTQRLEKVCTLLSLERPEIRIEAVDGLYKAAAYFRDNPFLVRAGAIGSIRGVIGEDAALGACAERVVRFVIDMVREDTLQEDELASERDHVHAWKKSVVKEYVNHGLLGPEARN